MIDFSSDVKVAGVTYIVIEFPSDNNIACLT